MQVHPDLHNGGGKAEGQFCISMFTQPNRKQFRLPKVSEYIAVKGVEPLCIHGKYQTIWKMDFLYLDDEKAVNGLMLKNSLEFPVDQDQR